MTHSFPSYGVGGKKWHGKRRAAQGGGAAQPTPTLGPTAAILRAETPGTPLREKGLQAPSTSCGPQIRSSNELSCHAMKQKIAS